MLKKRIILILLLISLITNVSVFATDVDTDGNTTTGEIVSPPTENTVTGNTEQKPEKEPEKEEEPKQEEPTTNNNSNKPTPERNNRPSYESQTTKQNIVVRI